MYQDGWQILYWKQIRTCYQNLHFTCFQVTYKLPQYWCNISRSYPYLPTANISSTCLQAAAPPHSSVPQLTRLWNMAKHTVKRCWLDSNGFTVHFVRSSCHDEVDVKTSSLMVRRSITGTAVTRCSPVDQRGSAALMQADATLLLPSRCIRNYSTYFTCEALATLLTLRVSRVFAIMWTVELAQ